MEQALWLLITSLPSCSAWSCWWGQGAALPPEPLVHPVLPSYLTSLAQKMPAASFEDLFPLAKDAAEVFSQCCDSVAEDCMQRKVGEPGAHPKNTS